MSFFITSLPGCYSKFAALSVIVPKRPKGQLVRNFPSEKVWN